MLTRNSRLHNIWLRAHGDLVMPQEICLHELQWQVYDMHLAGCLQCGAQHVCNTGACEIYINDEGDQICSITGLCLESLNLSHTEFVSTVGQFMHAKKCADHTSPVGTEWCEGHITRVVDHILCSDSWERCRRAELRQRSEKCSDIMVKQLKQFKQVSR